MQNRKKNYDLLLTLFLMGTAESLFADPRLPDCSEKPAAALAVRICNEKPEQSQEKHLADSPNNR
jgi:hypothetical protein